MIVAPLSSGSAGNSYYFESDGTSILVDAGLGPRDTRRRLEQVGRDIETLRAIVVTHEHYDHIRGAERIARKYGIPIYLTQGTLEASQIDRIETPTVVFPNDSTFTIGELEIHARRTLHDAAAPARSSSCPSPSSSRPPGSSTSSGAAPRARRCRRATCRCRCSEHTSSSGAKRRRIWRPCARRKWAPDPDAFGARIKLVIQRFFTSILRTTSPFGSSFSVPVMWSPSTLKSHSARPCRLLISQVRREPFWV